MSKKFLVLFSLCLLIQFGWIQGHGYLKTPAARSSAWRKLPGLFPSYYDDNQMYCGGISGWVQNGYKCSICGENFSGPKMFEKGGALYTGRSVETYTQGQQIEVVVEVKWILLMTYFSITRPKY